jgi:dihydrolipoamide dehydrogenase
MPGLMPGADHDLVRIWEKLNKPRFDRIMLKTKTVAVEARKDAVYATFEGEGAPQGPQPYDRVLMSVGRTPNGNRIAADRAGVSVTERGYIPVDSQMRTNVAHIHAIGDVVGQPMLAHKAVHEGHVAAEAAAGHKSHFDARVIRRSPGSDSPRTRRRRRASRSPRACCRGLRRAAPSPTDAMKGTPSSCSTRRRTGSSEAASSARTPAT